MRCSPQLRIEGRLWDGKMTQGDQRDARSQPAAHNDTEVRLMKIGMFLSLVILISPATAQTDSSQDGTRSAVCTFEDGKQMSVRYNGNASGAKLKNGQLWPNADPPMLLFTQASLRIENSSIPIGAYGVYV